MFLSYWRSVARRAFKETLVLFDLKLSATILGLLILAGTSAALHKFGSTESAYDEWIEKLVYVSIVVFAFPFAFLWKFISVPAKMAQEMKEHSQQILQELSHLKLGSGGEKNRIIASKKLLLAENLSKMKSLALVRGAWGEQSSREQAEQFVVARSAAQTLAEEFSYDEEIWRRSLDYIQWCGIIISMDKNHENSEEERKQLHGMAKELMRLLHCS